MIACSNTLQTKKIITKAKKIQNQQRINRQTRQTQQKDARQNIINKRRGMQVTVQAILKLNTIFFFLPSWMMNFQTLIWSNLYSVTVWCFICWTVLWPAIKSLSIGSNTLTGLQIIFVSWKDLCPAKSLFCSNKTNTWWDTKNKKAKSEKRVVQINYVTTLKKKNVCYLY